MTEFLVRKFVKNSEKTDDIKVRSDYGTLTGICGIVSNIALFAGKFIIGTIMGSVSVTADAFNNLSDSASSMVGLVGAKLAAKPADEDHPFGHGRYEYIAALVVAFLILEVAFSCFKSSLDRIVHPETTVFSLVSVIILAVSILIKVWLSHINRKLGKLIDSKVMLATAKDALGDVIITSATVVSILITRIFEINIDGYVGCAVSFMIFVAGINVAKDTIEPLIGQAADSTLCKAIINKVESYESIEGSHDLIVHSYGPSRRMATIHAEVRNDINIETAHEIIDRIERDVLKDMNIFLVIHMDPIEVKDETVLKYKKMVKEVVKILDEKASIHDFRMVNGEEHINLVFDLVLPYSYQKDKGEDFKNKLNSLIKQQNEKLNCVITVEYSYVEEEK